MTLADQIRAMLANPRRHVHGSETVALTAVLDKCQAMREEARRNGLGSTVWIDSLTHEFESVIARELGITTEETS